MGFDNEWPEESALPHRSREAHMLARCFRLIREGFFSMTEGRTRIVRAGLPSTDQQEALPGSKYSKKEPPANDRTVLVQTAAQDSEHSA